jgi:hypothetical protein
VLDVVATTRSSIGANATPGQAAAIMQSDIIRHLREAFGCCGKTALVRCTGCPHGEITGRRANVVIIDDVIR